MPSIHLLPETLINQIAAGEVVERPASIVKELIENSIDAGSSKIVIEVQKGGRDLIKITDNGCGMNKDDALLSFARHATSKISSFEDLHSISSLGFRGEAIASIASVSHMTLKTKIKTELSGTLIYNEGGKIIRNEDIGCPDGTQFEIKNLFFNTPARRKFLKTENTEYTHILNTATNLMLAFPKISFKLSNNNKEVFDLPATDNLEERIRALLGGDYSDGLISVFYGGKETQIEGFIGKPEFARNGKSAQYLFVNNREIKNNYLAHAILDGYRSLLPSQKYPVFVIKISIAPHLVDVNVHPRKLEVRFVNQQEVYSAVKNAVKAALGKNVLMPAFVPQGGTTAGEPDTKYSNNKYGDTIGELSLRNGNKNYITPRRDVAMQRLYGTDNKYPTIKQALSFTKNIAATVKEFDFDRIETRPKASIRPLSQLAQNYIIAENEEGLVLIDQHAAHERILYSILRKNLDKTEILTQPLLIPLTLELSFKEIKILEENKELLNKIGFEIEALSGNSFAINAVPACLTKENVIEIIKGCIEDLLSEKPLKSQEEKPEQVIHYLACRSAVKFGKKLTLDEQYALIERLEAIPQKYTCPHGRPTMIKLTFDELEKRFGRK